MIVVQVVRTAWSKSARGAPGAELRASVPDGFDLAAPTDAEVVVDSRVATASTGFVPAGALSIAGSLPLTIDGYEVSTEGATVVVRRQSTSRPHRGERTCLRLPGGEWGRAISNRRIADEHAWRYEKVVVNLAHVLDGPSWDPATFTSTPGTLVDEQVPLF